MLELGIIICIGVIIVLVIRRYPGIKAPGRARMPQRRNFGIPDFSAKKIFSKRKHVEEDEIKNSFDMENENIISPREIEEAKEEFDADDPEVAKFLHEAGQAINEKDYNKAEEKAIEAIAVDNRCDQAYAFVALVALRRGEFENANVAAKTSLKCNPENATAHAVIGEVFLQKEKHSDAIDSLLKAVMLDRNEASWYGLLGQAYMEVRQFAKSAKAFKRAASLDIENREYRRLAAIAEEKQQSHSRVFRAK